MQSFSQAALRLQSHEPLKETSQVDTAQRKANRVRWLKLNFTVKAARLQTLKRQKYQHLQEEALLKARGLLKNWENNAVVLTEDLYRLAAGEREAAELMNYTPEALALRFSLRNNPQVLEAVRELWRIEMPRDAMGCIDQRGYASVFRRIAKSLDAKAFKRKQKVDKLLDEDWKRDSKGEPTMGFANFFDSIFELADLWCETIDADDYVSFLERLRDRISHVRHSKRSFKAMQKIGAFDADSDEEEEEEEEEDDDEESEEEKPPPAAQVITQPRILVAKAIKPVVQPQPVVTSKLRKVSRVAVSSAKVLHRNDLSASSEKPTTSPAAPTAATVAPTVPIPVSTPPLRDVSTPLLQSQGSLVPVNRQRRASVVTTIQFLQDGVRSVSEITASGGPHVDGRPHTPPSAAIPHAVSAAFAANAKREQPLRLSLASAAAAALARNEETPPAAEASPLQVQPTPESSLDQHNPLGNRKRTVTVFTAKHAVLKSVVFATRKAGKHSTEDSQAAKPTEQSSDRPTEVNIHTTQEQPQGSPHQPPEQEPSSTTASIKSRGPPSGPSAGNPFSNATAIRIRTGSLFDLDGESGNQKPTRLNTTSKGSRLGFGKAPKSVTKRGGRGGLAPLHSPVHEGAGPAFNGSVGVQRNALAAVQHSLVPASGVSGHTTNGGIDFSDSVVMTNYIVDRSVQGAQALRTPTILGSNLNKPALAMAPAAAPPSSQSQGIQGTRVLAKQSPILQASEPATPHNGDLPKKKPLVVLLKQSEPQSSKLQMPSAQVPHRYNGHALHAGVGKRELATPRPEGDPEEALRIKAALDREHALSRGMEPHGRLNVNHERHFEHTDPDAVLDRPTSVHDHHSMMALSIAHGSKPLVRPVQTSPVKIMPRKNMYVDPLATPWDTFDDDDDNGDPDSLSTSARSLLRPENAMEALAKVISKRAASLSAGSSRGRPNGSSAPLSASSVRRQTRAAAEFESYYDYSDSMEKDPSELPQLPSLLTVSSLGGSSIESGRRTIIKLVRRGSHEEYVYGSEELLESSSAPVLSTMAPLELDYSRYRDHGSPPKQLARSPSQAATQGPLIKLPIRGRGHNMDSVDDLELCGELAMDPSLSPPRPPIPTSPPRTSPAKMCTCARRRNPESIECDTDGSQSWPPPIYRLDRAVADSEQNDPDRPDNPGGKCESCYRRRRRELTDATVILNATRELYLEPQTREDDVVALIQREPPTRSEMMRRRHRYTRGKPK